METMQTVDSYYSTDNDERCSECKQPNDNGNELCDKCEEIYINQ